MVQLQVISHTIRVERRCLYSLAACLLLALTVYLFNHGYMAVLIITPITIGGWRRNWGKLKLKGFSKQSHFI